MPCGKLQKISLSYPLFIHSGKLNKVHVLALIPILTRPTTITNIFIYINKEKDYHDKIFN